MAPCEAIPHYDAEGNILRYTDTMGNIVAAYTYDAFGRAIDRHLFSFTSAAPYAVNEKPTGEWNTAVLECRGDAVTCYFNGKLVNKATHVSPAKGRIQLQSEGCGIEFRRVTIEPAPSKSQTSF